MRTALSLLLTVVITGSVLGCSPGRPDSARPEAAYEAALARLPISGDSKGTLRDVLLTVEGIGDTAPVSGSYIQSNRDAPESRLSPIGVVFRSDGEDSATGIGMLYSDDTKFETSATVDPYIDPVSAFQTMPQWHAEQIDYHLEGENVVIDYINYDWVTSP